MIIETIYKKLEKTSIDEDEIISGLIGGIILGLIGGLIWGLILGLIWGLILGLIWGLILGLIGGLISGLIYGLIWGLIGGLIYGLIWGLIYGLIWGLGGIIGTGLASLITHYPNLLPIWILIIIILVILEIYFWMDKSKPKNKKNIIWFTLGKKLEALIESIATLGVLNLIRISYERLKVLFIDWNEILKWTGYIGAGIIGLAIICLIIYGYLKLNSLKYRK